MKKFSYLLMAASLLLLIACPGDVVDSKEAILNRQLKSVISPEMMKTIKGMGMPIHYGTNPPDVEGTYLADDQTMKKSNIEDDDPPGTKYKDEVLTISDQDNDSFTAKLKLETESYSNTYSMVISGMGDNFTLYASTKVFFYDNTSANAVVIYSGTIKDGELHDLHNGMFITDEEYFGMGQIYYEADGVANKIGGGDSIGGGKPIRLVTTKAVGESVYIVIRSSDNSKVWIDLNNNGKKDLGETLASSYYRLGAQTIDIYGDITHLDCDDCGLISLDVSGCKTLQELQCHNNQLTSLDLSKCIELENLGCGRNKLTSLDLSKCTALKFFNCNYNQITSLNINGCRSLVNIYCQDNKINTLNVEGLASLRILHCQNNNILQVRPAIFDRIYDVRYDIRYEYRWDSGLKKYVVSKDHGKGYWYAHEPKGGCHKPNPCND